MLFKFKNFKFMTSIVITSAKRTAIGKFMGSLSGLSAPELGSFVINSILEETRVNKEVIDIQRGKIDLLLPASDWQEFEGPASFTIPANTKFRLRVNS